jgi:dTDP-4-amino-4,6-dideoxygalactose transaminase
MSFPELNFSSLKDSLPNPTGGPSTPMDTVHVSPNLTTNLTTSSNPQIPQPELRFLDLKKQFAAIREEVLSAVASVFDSQTFILGKEVLLFEQELAAFLGVPFAIGCASGSDALYLALTASHIGPGDEVITTPFTFIATAGAIARTGATTVFVDIQPETFNIDPSLIEAAITEKTRAILPVHLFGLPVDMQPLLRVAHRNGLVVVEDAAQAIGARYQGRRVGSLGDFGCFSFFPSKNLGCAGDGGLITTSNPAMAERLRLLRAHGSRHKYHYEILGTNSRLDALQAAILRVKLRHLEEWQEARRRRAALYFQLFQDYELLDWVGLPSSPPSSFHVYNQFVIRCPDRTPLRVYLQEHGIPTELYYPEPLHLQPAFSYLGYRPASMRQAEEACQKTLALPIYPELRDEDQERTVRTIANFYRLRS